MERAAARHRQIAATTCRFGPTSFVASSGARLRVRSPHSRRPAMASRVVHVEVTGKDGAALQRFYSDVFGWTLETDNPGGYGMYRQGEITGGIGAAQPGQPGMVTFYV